MNTDYTTQELEDYIDSKVALNQKEFDAKHIDEPLRTIWNKSARISTDVSAVDLLYLAGFDGIMDGTIKASDTLTNWVKSIDRRRSANLMGGICAVFLTATLEHCIQASVEHWCENCEDANKQTRSLRIDSLDKLREWIRPTAKSGEWFKRLGKLLGYKADPKLVAILEGMLKHRTTTSHEDIGGLSTPTGEQIKLWGLATCNLVYEIIRSIEEKTGKQSHPL